MMSAAQVARANAEAGRGALCLDWTAEYHGQKRPALEKCKLAKPYDQSDGLDMFFGQRTFLNTNARWLTSEYTWHDYYGEVRAYTVHPEPDPSSYAGWFDAYHGTHMYAIANIARYGKLLASEAKSLGHTTLTDGPGV